MTRLLALLLCLAASPAWGDDISGHVTKWVDGDTLWVAGVKVRLWGIDSPERKQECQAHNASYSCGAEAGEALKRLIGDSVVTCQRKDKSYDRIVGQCFANGVDISAEMVRTGWALDWADFSDGYYAALEAEAQRARVGLWAGCTAVFKKAKVEWRGCE